VTVEVDLYPVQCLVPNSSLLGWSRLAYVQRKN
jgi:hypothetical protein